MNSQHVQLLKMKDLTTYLDKKKKSTDIKEAVKHKPFDNSECSTVLSTLLSSCLQAVRACLHVKCMSWTSGLRCLIKTKCNESCDGQAVLFRVKSRVQRFQCRNGCQNSCCVFFFVVVVKLSISEN